jgi:hypothetical protein
MNSPNDRPHFVAVLLDLDGHTLAELRTLDSAYLEPALGDVVDKTADPAKTRTSCSNATGAN